MARKPEGPLRRGWTTGACATAASAAAFSALATGRFPDPVAISLPGGEEPRFPLVRKTLADGTATASVVKDAGDDPDVTHGAEVVVAARRAAPGTGVVFRAGEGVGVVTKPGLPLAVGEPAINPKPRAMIAAAVRDLARLHGCARDVEIAIGVVDGAALAEKTWNPRLGIEGGLSILGTTGIVIPYSCSAWIHSIHRGVDVARATGLRHIAGATGRVSEAAARDLYDLEDGALIDMGDFAGGMLKYLRAHPVPRVTVAGGFAKLVKLGQGAMDLHSSRSRVDRDALAGLARAAGADEALALGIVQAPSAGAALALARERGFALADAVARRARENAMAVLAGRGVLDVVVVDREGAVVGRAGP